MTTPTLAPVKADVDARQLIADIEQYLAQQASTRTAHPLVTKTTAELVTEALGTQPAPVAAPTLEPPSRLWRILPDWTLSIIRQLHAGTTRHITVAQHLELTALVIERYGWERGALRTNSGRRCILGAQAVLFRLGYGDEHTAHAAGRHMQNILAARGITDPYHRWNDQHGRSKTEILHLIRTAAANAGENR
ncbi:hypothetical protein ACIGO8_08110 [Streptomyces sp. NPDC053493]|uniref:DUF6197 family protein n=1 Tax=Streptomyces sp. NPDC053493 TaxID=3365705 RepID=UPI0037D5A6A8